MNGLGTFHFIPPVICHSICSSHSNQESSQALTKALTSCWPNTRRGEAMLVRAGSRDALAGGWGRCCQKLQSVGKAPLTSTKCRVHG